MQAEVLLLGLMDFCRKTETYLQDNTGKVIAQSDDLPREPQPQIPSQKSRAADESKAEPAKLKRSLTSRLTGRKQPPKGDVQCEGLHFASLHMFCPSEKVRLLQVQMLRYSMVIPSMYIKCCKVDRCNLSLHNRFLIGNAQWSSKSAKEAILACWHKSEPARASRQASQR